MKRTVTWLVFLALLFGLLAQQQTAFAIGQGDLIKANDGFEVGKTVFFGEFKQNSKNSVPTPIEWIILDIKDGEAYLISKYGLDCRTYHGEEIAVTWDTCYLRTWLNNDFYQTAFTLAEQELICLTTVTADKNPNPQYAELYPGKDTQDHVFIPSMLEIQKYMPRASDRLCRPTQYAIDRYASNINGCSWWWLRTRGDRKTWTGIINVDGTMPLDGERVNGKKGVVRPCIWVKIPQSANTSASSGSENANTQQTNGSSSPANASSNVAGKLDYKTYASYNWVKAYREFLLSGNYAKDQQYVMDGEPIVCALYDMNRDNVPELFISNGDKTLYGARMYVYTYAEEQLKYCGIVKYIYKLADEEANKKYPGLFEEEGGAGTYLSYYVKLDANYRIEYTKIETRHDFETDYKTNDHDLLAVKDMQKNNVTKYRIGTGEFEISVVEWCSAH